MFTNCYLGDWIIKGKGRTYNVTGFIAKNEKEFANFSLDLFKNNEIFNNIRNNLIKIRGNNNWTKVSNNLIKELYV